VSARLRPLLALLTALALLALPGAALAVTTKVQPGSTWISVELPTRGGWQVEIGTAVNGESRTPVSISANDRAAHASLSYGVHGRWTKDGTIVAKFPGIGRVNLRFDQAAVKKETDNGEPGCTVGRETLVRKGTFRGRIKLDDPEGFGRVNLGEAPGTIYDSPPKPARCASTARRIAPRTRPKKNWSNRPARCRAASTPAASSTAASSRSTSKPFRAVSSAEREGHSSSSPRASTRSATDSRRTRPSLRHRSRRDSNVTAAGEATIAPPAPFSGSATFKLQSPTAASWTGDLSVEIPTLGKVLLTAPGTWSTLCEGTTCTETLPSGTRVSLVESD
jgi:hypothetical protein